MQGTFFTISSWKLLSNITEISAWKYACNAWSAPGTHWGDTYAELPANLHSLKLSLSIPSPVTFLLSNTACEHNNEDVKESNETGGGAHEVDVIADELLDHVSAADIEHILRILGAVENISSAAAGVGDLLAPVGGILDSAAMELLLHVVPGGGDLLVIDLAVVGHRVLHGDAEISTEKVGSDTGANLCDEDEDDDESVGVDHAFILTHGAAAAEESDHEDDDADDDEENWGVDEAICKKFIEGIVLDLNIGSKPNKG